MGQHKFNPTAIAAKNGELPPKPPKMSKRESEAALYAAMGKAMHEIGLLTPDDLLDDLGLKMK